MPEKIDDTLVGCTLTSLNIKAENIQIDNSEEQASKNENNDCFEIDMNANDPNDLNTNENNGDNGNLTDHADDFFFYS